MNQCPLQSRSAVIDTVKGFAIMLVVLGHCIQYGSGAAFFNANAFYDDPVFRIIYSFHMPLFAIVSGYLFYFSISRRTVGVIFKKQLSSLFVPIVVWSVLFFVAIQLQNFILKGLTLDYSILSCADFCLRNLWFLWAILWSSLIIIFVRTYLRDSIVIYGLILVASLFLPNLYNIDLYVYLYPYYVGAYLWNKYEVTKRFDQADRFSRSFPLCIAGWLLLLLFFQPCDYIYTSGTGLLASNGIGSQLGINTYRWLVGLLGSLSVILLIVRLKPEGGGDALYRKIRWEFISLAVLSISICYCHLLKKSSIPGMNIICWKPFLF